MLKYWQQTERQAVGTLHIWHAALCICRTAKIDALRSTSPSPSSNRQPSGRGGKHGDAVQVPTTAKSAHFAASDARGDNAAVDSDASELSERESSNGGSQDEDLGGGLAAEEGDAEDKVAKQVFKAQRRQRRAERRKARACAPLGLLNLLNLHLFCTC